MTIDPMHEMVRDANPVPDLDALEPIEMPILSDRERSGEMQTQQPIRVETEDRPSRRNRVIALAAAAVFILLGALIAIRALQETEVVDMAPPNRFQHLEVSPNAGSPIDLANEHIPYYARFHSSGPPMTDGEWRMIYFYRPPECIPADFDLKDFFHFPDDRGLSAFGCPLLFDGTTIWGSGGFDGTTPPSWMELDGLGSVPVWFVPEEEFRAIMVEGELTIEKLESLRPLKGTATEVHEVLEYNRDWTVSLSGSLEDGRLFEAFWMGGTTIEGELYLVFR